MTEIAAGKRLRSQECGTEVIVVRAPDQPVELTCGGSPMTAEAVASDIPASGIPVPAKPVAGEGAQLGKRYIDEPTGLELLCTKPGGAVPAADGRALTLKTAKPLPASDLALNIVTLLDMARCAPDTPRSFPTATRCS
jgi:hypothetical protein